jgi:hypothetical protein
MTHLPLRTANDHIMVILQNGWELHSSETSHSPKHFDEITSLFSADCPFGKLSVREHVRSAKRLRGLLMLRSSELRDSLWELAATNSYRRHLLRRFKKDEVWWLLQGNYILKYMIVWRKLLQRLTNSRPHDCRQTIRHSHPRLIAALR